ncbi:DUF4836 family protein [Paraflavitalea pollutisoli]|uniref:DUF4836 family protein n=1 Tax=Paraflavitalea pollutisoli TaxID=3034143 RepID=UPI0023EC0595|nr:DUF4836 family protein [Paraflavitalea sp. H1-2-19X]
MQRTSFLSLLAVAFVLISSCSSSDKSAVAIPKDAGFVFHINTASLSSKLSWQEIQSTQWFKKVSAQSEDSLAKQLLDNPDKTGINMQADLVFFVKKQGRTMYTVFEGEIKDVAAFEGLNKQIKPEGKKTTVGDISVFQSDEKSITTWKGNRFISLFAIPMPDAYKFSPDGEEQGTPKIHVDTLINFAKSLYDLKSSASLTSDDRFNKLLKEPGDVHVWVSSDNFTGDLMGDVLSATKISDLIKGNISAFTLSFENGKIDAKSTSYYNEEMGKLLSKYKMKDIDADILSRLPSENLVGVMSFNYPPDGLREFLKVAGFEGMANGGLGKVGYSLDEFVKANKGDLLIAASDFTLTTEQRSIPSYEEGGTPYTYTKNNPKVNVLFATSINDKAAFEKLVSVVKEQTGGWSGDSTFPITYSLNDKWFALGNSVDQVNKFLAGDAKNKHAAIGKLAGHPVGFYVDLKKILTTWDNATPATDSTTKAYLTESVNMWEDVIATGNGYSGGSVTGHFEINLVNKSVNSLKQLNQYIDKMAAQGNSGRTFSF